MSVGWPTGASRHEGPGRMLSSRDKPSGRLAAGTKQYPALNAHSQGRRLSLGARPEEPGLGDDIRRDLVFDEGDAVAQLQLALLQPLQPQQIGRGRLMQGIDRRVEIAVLLLQPCELGFEFALIFVGHGVR
jgi:hypothetical protein